MTDLTQQLNDIMHQHEQLGRRLAGILGELRTTSAKKPSNGLPPKKRGEHCHKREDFPPFIVQALQAIGWPPTAKEIRTWINLNCKMPGGEIKYEGTLRRGLDLAIKRGLIEERGGRFWLNGKPTGQLNGQADASLPGIFRE